VGDEAFFAGQRQRLGDQALFSGGPPGSSGLNLTWQGNPAAACTTTGFDPRTGRITECRIEFAALKFARNAGVVQCEAYACLGVTGRHSAGPGVPSLTQLTVAPTAEERAMLIGRYDYPLLAVRTIRRESGSFSTQSSPSRSIDGHGSGLSASQTPEKSGFSSAARGVAAERSGLPSGVFGTAGFGYVNHYADSSTPKAIVSVAARTTQRQKPFAVCCGRRASAPESRAA
jgi:hypothetical protein